MNTIDILIALEDHELVAVDANGDHCRCGAVLNFLDHYAAVGLEAGNVPGTRYDVGPTTHTPEQDLALRRILITPDQDAAIAVYLTATAPTQRAGIRRRLEEAGLHRLTAALPTSAPLARRGVTDDAFRAIWAEGLSDPDIGRRLGLGRSTVRLRRHRLRLPANSRGGRRKVAA